MKMIFIIFFIIIPFELFSQAITGGNAVSSNINNAGTGFGTFIAAVSLFFVIPYIVAIFAFSRIKKYNFTKLLCGLTVFWIILSVMFACIVYLITGGTISTKGGIESSLTLSIIFGVLIGWAITLLGLTIIERVGAKGIGSLANDIIKNSNQMLFVRLINAFIVFVFGIPVKLIYKWAKNKIEGET